MADRERCGTGVLVLGEDASDGLDILVSLADLGYSGPVNVRDLWKHKDLDVFTDKFTQTINSHGAGLYRLRLQK